MSQHHRISELLQFLDFFDQRPEGSDFGIGNDSAQAFRRTDFSR